MRWTLSVVLLVAPLLAAGPGHAQDGDRSGAFAPERFFAGRTRSEGAFLGASKPGDRFTGETRGRREPDGATTFDQVIRFDDGKVRRRDFRLVRTGPGTLEVTGSEVVGVARGEIGGRTLRLVSTIRNDPANPLLDVEFEQEMELQDDGRTLRNRSTVRKFGIVLLEADERFVQVGSRRRARRAGR